ncbi:hypothetical protein XpopCFBP1817_11690 [Xanthomonas populi]|uniref:Ubiquitin-like protease family profile domain-containing protein n=2 Tax=Xanthomonas populi TaxID=53414 RepID=A0A2S7ENG8_9XANT|nr:hypothetical protein XpopCFBP1817_11690 [Xanthomonas populi]
MHPLLEFLPRRNPVQVHTDSSVHRMRAAAPTSGTHTDYSKILDLSESYGNGERIAELKRSLPSFTRFLKDCGLSHIRGMQMLRELNDDQRDHVIHQIIRRIGNCIDPEHREIALSQLELDCSKNIALSQLAWDRIAEAKAKAKAEVEAKAKAKSEAKARQDPCQGTLNDIINLLPRYEALEPISSIMNDMPGFQMYLRGDGSYGKAGLGILQYATPDHKKRLNRAIKKRRQGLPPQNSNSAKLKGIIRVLHKKPNLILEISRKFSDRACSINDASSGYLSQSELEKIVDEETGELRSLGEKLISGASEGIQAAIRENFRIRYQKPDQPPNSPPQHEENLPLQSFFSGVSADLRRMGYQPEPDTPQYPPQSPASVFSGLSSMSHYGREFDLYTPQEIEQPFHQQEENLPLQSFFSGVSADLRRMGYQPEPDTPQYPPQSPASVFSGLSSMSHYGREFDLYTPQEIEQPWSTYGDYGTQTPRGHSPPPAMSPERIDVDNLPSPQDVADPELPQVTATSWLLDGHLHAYTQDLARRLRGEPNAHLLHFADSQVVTMLNSEDEAQRDVALRRLVGDADNPAPPIVFMPINRDDVHWSLLVVDRRDNHSPAAYHYDSMGAPHPNQHWHAQMAAWRLGLDASQVNKMPTAIQPDGYSCGDHVLTGIDVLAHRVVDGSFDDASCRDLSDIEPDRGLIRDLLAQAKQAPAESSARQVPERPVEQKKKKSKWWKF